MVVRQANSLEYWVRLPELPFNTLPLTMTLILIQGSLIIFGLCLAALSVMGTIYAGIKLREEMRKFPGRTFPWR